MIYNSEYWKDDLIKTSKRLNKAKQSKSWSDRDLGNFEKDVMLGFYSIRKLKEAGKLSDSTFSDKIKITKYKLKENCVVHHYNADNYPEYYDMANPIVDNLEVSYFSDQIIHSYVFSPVHSIDETNGGETLERIHFNSDRSRKICVYELEIDFIVKLFKDVGNDYPSCSNVTFDVKKADFVFNNFTPTS